MARVSLCVFCFYLDCLTLTEGHPDKGVGSAALWSWALLSPGVDAEAPVCRVLASLPQEAAASSCSTGLPSQCPSSQASAAGVLKKD